MNYEWFSQKKMTNKLLQKNYVIFRKINLIIFPYIGVKFCIILTSGKIYFKNAEWLCLVISWVGFRKSAQKWGCREFYINLFLQNCLQIIETII